MKDVREKPILKEQCWEWPRARSKAGYGQLWSDGKVQYVHRLMYEHVFGPIPAGMEIDHLCRNHACIQPAHLEAVTHQENMRRGIAGKVVQQRAKSRTHCKRGHEFTEENTYHPPGVAGRQCKECNRENTRKHRAMQRD